jgi:hypothetical protein
MINDRSPGLPPFDGTTIHAGQRVEVESANMMPAMSGTMVADKIQLEQQALTGTVANFTAGTGGPQASISACRTMAVPICLSFPEKS